jgi:hypothetical protein
MAELAKCVDGLRYGSMADRRQRQFATAALDVRRQFQHLALCQNGSNWACDWDTDDGKECSS